MTVWIKGGELVDPVAGTVEPRDLLVERGKVARILPPGGGGVVGGGARTTTIDASGRLVLPGLIDMHVHLREPGHEYKETVATGAKAAAAGGFTAVACMPNTAPPNDCRSVTEFIMEQARRAGYAKVYPVAAITQGQRGESLSEFGDLRAAGAVAVSDDGYPVMGSEVMRRAMEYAAFFDLAVISHCEDLTLSAGGVMHEGRISTRMGLTGIPAAAEANMVYRDISLARLTGRPVHIAHVSTAVSIGLIRRAKKEGIPVTAETAPHYFTLDHTAVIGYDTHAKMNPPLRTHEDVEAVQRALAEGVIDVIATDHAPHSPLEKEVEFDKAAFGIIGLETALPLTLDLVRKGVLDMAGAVRLLSTNPAALLKVPGGRIREGGPADLTLVDPKCEYVLCGDDILSKSRNSPFIGKTLKGRADLTMIGGKIVWQRHQ